MYLEVKWLGLRQPRQTLQGLLPLEETLTPGHPPCTPLACIIAVPQDHRPPHKTVLLLPRFSLWPSPAMPRKRLGQGHQSPGLSEPVPSGYTSLAALRPALFLLLLLHLFSGGQASSHPYSLPCTPGLLQPQVHV